MWFSVYEDIESYYTATGVDANEGWDVSIVESTPDSGCTVSHRDHWTRINLGVTLMGDGYFDGQAYRQDEAFHKFLGYDKTTYQGDIAYAPYSIPEREFHLGAAVADYASYYPAGQIKPLHYRHFRRATSTPLNPEEYTVVVNVYDVSLGGVPAEDAMWYYGHHSSFPQPDSLLIWDHWRGRAGESMGASMFVGVSGPLQEGTRLVYDLGNQASVDLKVYDISGRMVDSVFSGEQDRGHQELIWNGTDTLGRPCSPGVYFWRLKVDDEAWRGRMVLLR